MFAPAQRNRIVWQDGSVRHWHYEDGRWPQSITDEAGVRYGTYAYDAQGRVTRSELAGGAERLDFAYATDASGKPTTTVTDYASGSATSRAYTFTDIGNVRYPSSLTAPCSLCGSTAQASTYNAAGDKTKEIAHDGSVTFFAYDAKGRETERASFPSSFNTATTRPALANATKVVSTKWHATFNLPTQVVEPGKVTANTYNSKGMLTAQSWTATTDATGAAKFAAVKTGSTFAMGRSYTAQQLVSTAIERETPSGTTTAIERARLTFTYDTIGSTSTYRDVTNNRLTQILATDAHGRVTRVREYGGTETLTSYDLRGRMRSVSFGSTALDAVLDRSGQIVDFISRSSQPMTAKQAIAVALSGTSASATTTPADPLTGDCGCQGGTWEQDTGFSNWQFSAQFGAYFSGGPVTYKCSTNQQVKAEAKQICIGGGPGAQVGVSVNVNGRVFDTPSCRALGGWSNHSATGNLFIFGAQGSADGGGNAGVGAGFGGGGAYIRCLTYYVKCYGCRCSEKKE